MKKAFLIIPLLIALTATPALANPGQEKRAEKANEKAASKQEVNEVTPEPTGTTEEGTVTYKNHGAYVSSVAKTHPGGEVVSAAARSVIGKKTDSSTVPTPTDSVSPTPTTDPSVTPSIEPSITETPEASPTALPSPIIVDAPSLTIRAAEAAQQKDFLGLKSLIESIKDFFTTFSNKA